MTQNPHSHTDVSLNRKSLKVERFADSATVAKEVGKYLNDLLTQYVEQPVLFLVAGGSAVAALEHINPEYLSPDLTVTTTDDRFSTELDINNFSILQSLSFYNHLVEADAFCISTEPFEDETIEMYRARFEKNLREWKQDFPKGIIIALYGMGADGHTGGMIPGLYSQAEFDAEFNDGDRLVGAFDAVAYDVAHEGSARAKGYEFPQRISTTIPFMRDWVDHAAFYIVGENKKPALDMVLQISDDTISTDVDFSTSPISIARFMKDATIFTDIK
ncbi:MAG: 6-phosphogluconolactonase [Candidatus Pacebacteria bacterium]|nr:6-phosphogluconolactonase [Candidatus Paceibacterota bacterium]